MDFGVKCGVISFGLKSRWLWSAVAACGFLSVMTSAHFTAAADCRSDPAPGVDWSQCNKRLLMLGGSNFEGANLEGTDFTYTDLRESIVKSVNFTKAKLVRTSLANTDLAGATLNKIEAYRSDFTNVKADKVPFVNAEMQRADFTGAHLAGADFSKAELGRANFENAVLDDVHFSMANLSRARFIGAKLGGAVDLQNAFLFLARFEGVDLSKVSGLSQGQLDLACGDANTKLPEGLTASKEWPCHPDEDPS
ncbi:pentapeptide repeat-containing protein [Agrobacterium sp. AGB01]|uniref:pentapeptide repeat-containing protein n=1 Tax=Agrobacterium sp. AGB01 TaxID=2769302 RepID=UPI001FEEB9AC|nr:pentapeptide repeat-containing protein [Agrobacterium sp. AGB01]